MMNTGTYTIILIIAAVVEVLGIGIVSFIGFSVRRIINDVKEQINRLSSAIEDFRKVIEKIKIDAKGYEGRISKLEEGMNKTEKSQEDIAKQYNKLLREFEVCRNTHRVK